MYNILEKSAIVVLFVAASSMVSAQQFTPIDISAEVTSDLRTWTYGQNYQPGGTELIVSGVPFQLAQFNNTPNTTGVVAPDPGPYSYTFAVPSGTYATVLYTLINEAFGAPGVHEGSITVTGTSGQTATLELISGQNIRDHNQNIFENNLVFDTAIVSTYFLNGAPTTQSIQSRLDRQQLRLPASFVGDPIASISFQGTAYGMPDGTAFVAALTLADESIVVPNLQLYIQGTNSILTWPASTYAFKLRSKTNLSQPDWEPVYPPPTIVSGQNFVTNSISSPQRFFILSQ